MKIYRMPQLAESSPGGACLLGPSELNSNALYFLYGRLLPKETGRLVAPKTGFEEVIFLVKGSVTARCGKKRFNVGPGEAFHAKEEVYLDNNGTDEAVYIAAGGRPIPGDEPAAKEEKPATPKTPPQITQPHTETPEPEKEEDEFTITLDDSPDDEGA